MPSVFDAFPNLSQLVADELNSPQVVTDPSQVPALDAPSAPVGMAAMFPNLAGMLAKQAANAQADAALTPEQKRRASLMQRGMPITLGARNQAEQQLRDLQSARETLDEAWLPNVKATAMNIGGNVSSMAKRALGAAEFLVNPAAISGSSIDNSADEDLRLANAYSQAAAERDQRQWDAGKTIVPPVVMRGARGAASTLPVSVVATALGGPYAGIASAMGQEANQAITEGKDAGLTGTQLSAYAASQGLIEGAIGAAFQRAGLGGLETTLSAKTITSQSLKEAAKQAGYRTLQEVPEEILTEWGHLAASKIAGVTPQSKDAQSLLQEIGQVAFDTTVQTAISMGAAESPQLVGSAMRRDPVADLLKNESSVSSMAASLVNNDPAKAATLASNAAPSRKQWEEAGMPRGASAAQRKAFVAQLQAAMENANRDTNPDTVTGHGQVAPDVAPIATQEAPPATEPQPAQPPADPRWKSREQYQAEQATAQQQAVAAANALTQDFASDPTPSPLAETQTDMQVGEVQQATQPVADAQTVVEPQPTKPPTTLGRRETTAEPATTAQTEKLDLSTQAPRTIRPGRLTDAEMQAIKDEERRQALTASRNEPAPKEADLLPPTVPPGQPPVNDKVDAVVSALGDMVEDMSTGPYSQAEQAQIMSAWRTVRTMGGVAGSSEQGILDAPPKGTAGSDVQRAAQYIRDRHAELKPRWNGWTPQDEDAADATPNVTPATKLGKNAARQAREEADAAPAGDLDPQLMSFVAKGSTNGKPIDRAAIAKTFPQGKITPVPNGYRVEIGSSYLDIVNVPSVRVNWDAIEARIGRTIPQSQRDKLGAAGAFMVVDRNGTKHSGLGIIEIDSKMADDATLRHEALHLAREAGLFTDKEWNALKKEYALPTDSDALAEEKIAKSREAWEGSPSTWEKIKTFLRRLMASMGLSELQARDVQALMDEAGFWDRTRKPRGDTADKNQLRPSIADHDLKYLRPLSDFSDTLYREVGGSRVSAYLPGSNIYDDGEFAEVFVATTPDLATGQGNNKGAMLEFDSTGLQGKLWTAKPTWQLSYENGDAELVARNNRQGTFQKALKSVTFKPDLQLSRLDKIVLQRSISQLESQGWTKETLENGDAKYTRPASQAKYQLRARPDLANPATSQTARDTVDQVDEQRNQAGEPSPRSEQQFQDAAREMLANDYEGTKRTLLAKGRAMEQLTESETVAAKEIVNREAEEAVRSGDKTKLKEAESLIDAYRRTGTAQATAFRLRYDPVESPAQRNARLIHEALLTPPRKEKVRRDKALASGNQQLADKITDEWFDKFQKLKEHLKSLGIDIDNLNEAGYDPIRDARIDNEIHIWKADAWDKFYEYRRNAMLSGLTTQFANTAGNFGNGMWHFTFERMAELAANGVMQRPEGAQVGEVKYIAAGIIPGIVRGWRNAMLSFNTERPEFERKAGATDYEYETPRVAISGVKGRGIRVPQRFMLAADQFAKTMFAEMEIGAQAYRLAKAEGLSGKALSDRMAELVADTNSDAWASTIDTVEHLAFMQKGSEVGQVVKRNLLDVRRKWRAAEMFLPFIVTPINILETGIKKSPLGTINVVRKMYDNYRSGENTFKGLAPEIAQQMIAWTAVGLIAGLNDDDDPWITGAAEANDPKTRDLAYRSNRPPMSVKLGGQWYSYSRFEPFATTMGMTIDWINGYKKSGAKGLAGSSFKSLAGQVGDKTFLQGTSDVIELFTQNEKVDEKLVKITGDTATSLIPNLVRQGGNADRDAMVERGVWGKGSEWGKRFGRRVVQKTELGIYGDETKYDLWGREIKTPTSPMPYTDWAYRMSIPVKNQDVPITTGDKFVLAWNKANPEEPYYPENAPKHYSRDGKTSYLSDEQYAKFARASGGAADKLVNRLDLDTSNPTQEQLQSLKDAISAARSAARDAVLSGGSPEPDEVAKVVLLDMATTHAKKVMANEPKSLTSKESREKITLGNKQRAVEEASRQARAWIRDSGLPRAEVKKAVKDWIDGDLTTQKGRDAKYEAFLTEMGW